MTGLVKYFDIAPQVVLAAGIDVYSPDSSVSVSVTNNNVPVDLYDDNGNAIDNPVPVDSTGFFQFRAAPGTYDLTYLRGATVLRVIDNVVVGGSGSDVGLFADLASQIVTEDVIQTSGYSTEGIGGTRYVYDATITPTEVSNFPRCCVITSNGRGFRLPLDGTPIDFEAFGAIGDDTTDCYAAWQAMQAYGIAHKYIGSSALDYVYSFRFPIRFNAQYYSSQPWSNHVCQSWFSEVGNNVIGGGHPVRVRFPADSYGVVWNFSGTDLDQKGTNPNWLSCDGSSCDGIAFMGGGGTDTSKVGVWIRCKMTFTNWAVDGFPGDNLRVNGDHAQTANGTNILYGNTNCSVIERGVLAASGRHAMVVGGQDANAMRIRDIDVLSAGCGGYMDAAGTSGGLGNFFDGCSVHGCGSKGLGGVSYGGNLYGLISTVAGAGAATTPGTDSTVWYLIGAGGVTGGYPAWSGAGTYTPSGPMLRTGLSSRDQWNNPYIEGGAYLAHIASPAIVYSANLNGSWTQASAIIYSNVGLGGQITANTGFGSFLQASGAYGNYMAAQVGGEMGTVIRAESQNLGTFRLSYGTEVYETFNNAGASLTHLITTPFSSGAAYPFGTGAVQPYVHLFSSFALGPNGNYARRITYDRQAQTSGAWATGDIVLNDGLLTGLGSAFYWQCTAAGTPGTWRAFYPYDRTSSTVGVGYATGAGGAITQTTGRTTGVTLNNVCGAITLVSAAGQTGWQSFTVTNSAVAATDTVKVCQKSGADKNMIFVTAVGAGSFEISFATTGGTTVEQPVFNFAVLKAVAS